MPGDNAHILVVARRLQVTVDAPVLGGIAVYLHGVRRATVDLDFYAEDRRLIAAELETAGSRWNADRREHTFDGVPIHTITAADAGIKVRRHSMIEGVRVVTLKDLVAIKLLCGLNTLGRSRDLGDVEDLIRAVPLDQRFTGGLPATVRSEFKRLVDAVRSREKSLPKDHRF